MIAMQNSPYYGYGALVATLFADANSRLAPPIGYWPGPSPTPTRAWQV